MDELLVLLKANMLQSLGLNKFFRSKVKSEKVRIALLTTILILGGLFALLLAFGYMYGFAQLLHSIGAFQYYLAFAVIIAWMAIFFSCLYMMPGYLLAFKDFNFLLALPVKPTAILLSKMLFLYLIHYIISLLIAIPIVVIDGIETNANPFFYVLAFMMTFFIPLLPMMVGAFVSFLLGKIATKFRSYNMVLLIGSFGLLLAIFTSSLFINAHSATQATLLPIIEKIVYILIPSALFMQGLQNLHLGNLLLFVGINIVPFVLFTAVFSKGFMSINAQMTETYKVDSYQMTALKTRGVFQALFRKELRSYFGSYIYVLNTWFGMILLTFFIILTPIVGSDFLKQVVGISSVGNMELPVFIAIFTVPVCLSCTTNCSISIEGRTYWIAKSLPIDTLSIFKSKIAVNLIVIIPLLVIDTVIAGVTFHLSFGSSILLLIVPSFYALLVASSGLLINLYNPKLIWDSQTVVVKQSLSVLLSLLFGFGIVLLSIGCFMIFQPQNVLLFFSVLLLVLVAANGIVWYMLKTKGVNLYRQL